MIVDQGVFLMLGVAGVALAALGILGVAVSRLMRRDRQVNAARQQVARGALSDPDLMAIAYAVRADKRRRVKSNRAVADRAKTVSLESVRGMTAEWDRQAVVAAAELICKENAR